MKIDPLICVGIALLLFVLFIANVYTFAYWAHPDDKSQSYFVRILIILGLQLSGMSVLLLPVDVANNGGDPACTSVTSTAPSVYCGGLNMEYCWDILFSVISFTVVAIFPFASFFHESEDTSSDTPTPLRRRIWLAVQNTTIFVCTYFLVQIILYYTFNSTDIPVRQYSFGFPNLVSESYAFTDDAPNVYSIIEMEMPLASFNSKVGISEQYITFPVNFAVYIMAFFGWLGWWPFSVFVGIGLASLPFELIYGYRYRPRPLQPDEIVVITADLQDRTSELLEISELLKRERKTFRQSRPSFGEARRRMLTDRVEINKLQAMVYILDRDVVNLRDCKTANVGFKPLIPFAKLFVGLIFGLLTMLWIVHICVYMLSDPPKSSFLNAYFLSFDVWFPLLGDVSYAIFSIYLLFCTVVGCFKFGVNLFFIKIHPMKAGETYLSSFLFNVGVILLCTIPVIQFCTQAFADFVHFSSVYVLLGVQVVYMNFFEYFYSSRFFVYVIIVSWSITVLNLMRKPRETGGSTEEFRKQLQHRGEGADQTDILIDEDNPMEEKKKGKGKGKGKAKKTTGSKEKASKGKSPTKEKGKQAAARKATPTKKNAAAGGSGKKKKKSDKE